MKISQLFLMFALSSSWSVALVADDIMDEQLLAEMSQQDKELQIISAMYLMIHKNCPNEELIQLEYELQELMRATLVTAFDGGHYETGDCVDCAQEIIATLEKSEKELAFITPARAARCIFSVLCMAAIPMLLSDETITERITQENYQALTSTTQEMYNAFSILCDE